jgi:Fe-S oxidoreductase
MSPYAFKLYPAAEFKKFAGVHPTAHLPLYVARKKTFMSQAKALPAPNLSAPAHGRRKAVLFATCLVNWNRPEIGLDAAAVLSHNGVRRTFDRV